MQNHRSVPAALMLSLAAAVGVVTVPAVAQTPAPAASPAPAVSPAKKELVQKILKLQQPGLEAFGNQLAAQTAGQVLQAAGQALPAVPADKREALAKEIQNEVRKFHDEVAPILRAQAVRNAPTTLGTALEEKFSEEELKTLAAWLESPVSRKFQQLTGEVQQGFLQKLVGDTRAQVEPKLKALEQSIGNKLKAVDGASGAKPPAPAQKKAEPAKK